MANFGRKKIAAALAFAAFFGSKASAKTIYPETVGAVGGRLLLIILKRSENLKV